MRWKTLARILLKTLLSALFLTRILLAGPDDRRNPSVEKVTQTLQKLHIPFLSNHGQVNNKIKFYSNTKNGTVFVTKKGEIVYSLRTNKKAHRMIVFKEEILYGKVTEITGEEKTATKVGYFKGNSPSSGTGNIPAYEDIHLGEVYKGIEVKVRSQRDSIEKLFYVKPYANPDMIKIKLIGATALRINENGELEVDISGETVTFTKPVAYQKIDGKRKEIPVHYSIQSPEDNMQNDSVLRKKFVYGFRVAPYDRTRELIIDPLLASTYLGGFSFEKINSVVVSPAGDVYVAGETFSPDLPITFGVFDGSITGSNDAFISKFNNSLTELLASTFLGGSFSERISFLAIDSHENIYATGNTFSSDFPVTPGAFDASFNGGSDAFLSKLDKDLTELLASTFLGGSSADNSTSVATHSDGNVFVAGSTASTNFPVTPNAFDTSFNGSSDAFISKLDSNLTVLLGSTFLGGAAFASESAGSLTIDPGGNLYVTGGTASVDFPITPGTFDTIPGGSFDVFISKLDNSLTILLASTLLGGFETEKGNFIITDPNGNIIVTGFTRSFDFPVTSLTFNTFFNGGNQDAFVSKLDASLMNLLASTYLGGFDSDSGNSLVLGPDETIYVSGNTRSPDFPTTPGAFDTSFNDSSDIFITKLNNTLTSLFVSTFLGGTKVDIGSSIARDTEGNIFVTGSTGSFNFPVTPDAFDNSITSDADAFLSQLDSELSSSEE
ncbi:MAG: hypothetical protein E3K32_01440 [wastewater metagenome]|nr:hypothetical protein [Candidatus Loosdrechtia aerotolerans]